MAVAIASFALIDATFMTYGSGTEAKLLWALTF